MSELLHRDVFPAEVFVADTGNHHFKARAFVTSDRVIVWTEGAGDEPVTVLERFLTGPPPERNRGTQGFGEIEVQTAEGSVFIARDQGCGCGSPLKRMDPVVPW